MLTLSTNAKEAIKIGLAMTIAYYVAMRFSWMSPTWAATAVAFISLPTAGQSIEKGLLRIGGTLLAFAAGLFFLTLFPQDRWYFFLAFTPYLAFVTYKMTGKEGQYFWFCAAFVSMMIINAGPGEGDAFVFAAYRTLETVVGVLIWTVVAVFIWPRSSRGTLLVVSGELLEALEQLLVCYRKMLDDRGTLEEQREIRARAGTLAAQLGQTIGAAASESYEVREVLQLWGRLHGLCCDTLEVLDRLQPGLRDLREIDIAARMGPPGRIFTVLESRLREARGLLAAQPQGSPLPVMPASLSTPRDEGLTHFQRAAVEVARAGVEQLDALTCALIESARELRGPRVRVVSSDPRSVSNPIRGPWGLVPLDPDRARGAIMVVVSMWCASLIWIYFNPPGHSAWYQFVPSLALAAAQYPQMRFRMLRPMACAYLTILLLYLFLMPKLSSFWQLGPLIFALTLLAAYFFNGVARVAIYLGMFNMLGISNQQTYDLARQANTLLFTLLGVALVVALTYILRSPRPEKAFLSMLRRFFYSSSVLISEWQDTPVKAESFWQRMKYAHHLQELRLLPSKLGVWGKQIDPDRYLDGSQHPVSNIVARIQTIAYRTEELCEARRATRASLLVEELGDEMQDWRLAIERGFESWSGCLVLESAVDLDQRLSQRLARLTARIEAITNRPARQHLSDRERRSFYRLLGGARGLSQAAIAYADAAGNIDWARWEEEWF